MTKIVMVDNYDSFVYNLVQYLAQLGAEVEVWRNDDPRFADDGWWRGADGVFLSPGPGTPEDAGVCIDVVTRLGDTLPIFGVCLGLQAMGVAYGGVVERADELLHGKTSRVAHDGLGAFRGIPSPFTATRYHSLAVRPDSVPDEVVVSARSVPVGDGAEGVIMGLRHRELPVEAVQFHPESMLTEHGYQMLANWLASCGDDEAPARAAGLSPLMNLAS